MIRILIADQHTLVREAIREALTRSPEVEVVGEARDARELLKEVENTDYDVVLLDFPVLSGGLEVLRELRKVRPHLPVIVRSFDSEEEYAIATLQAGASGYLTKRSATTELLEAVRSVVAGRKYVNSTLAKGLAGFLTTASGDSPA